tara:strand:- start:444 stop:1280 length:837 start_codon:yes stop_codon:yes gene_type:complete
MPLPSKHIVISFDDGPNNVTTPLLLDTLKKENVKASFFMVGVNIDNRKLMHRMLDEGHILGSHTWGHAHMTQLNDEQMMDQILHEERVFKSIVGDRPFFFRPPYGEINNKIRKFLTDRHYIVWKWNFDTYDWNKHTPKEVYDAAINVLARNEMGKGGGGIVLMHEYPWTTNAQKVLIPELKKRGYTLRDPLSMLSVTEMENLKRWSCGGDACEKFARSRRWCDCPVKKLRSVTTLSRKEKHDAVMAELYKIEGILFLVIVISLFLLTRFSRNPVYKKV